MAEMRLVDAVALKKTLEDAGLGEHSLIESVLAAGVYAVIDNAPTIDDVPVVHAEWEVVHVWKGNPQTTLRCSACKCSQPIYDHDTWLYCPFCGAKMDGGDPDGVAGTSGP